ncbi:MAG: tetratricopeptide repeat protein [Isosphaeraceae bacterium]
MTNDRRRRWPLLAVVLGASILGGGFGWWWYRTHSGPSNPGEEAYSRGDWEKAADLARGRLKAAGEDPDGLRLLARASVRLGRDVSAMGIYQRLGPEAMHAEDLYLLGLALKRTGKTKSAREVWEIARSRDPAHAGTLFELTQAYLTADAFDHAAALGRLLASRPGWESRAEALLGMIQFQRNDFAGAASYWQSALGRKEERHEGGPEPIVLRRDLVRALLRAGRPVEAREQVRIVLGESPDPEAYWLLSRVAIQQGAWDEARSALAKGGSFRDENPQLPDASPFVGSSRCAECHPAEFKSQQGSRHARTFFRATELGGLELPPSAVPDRSDPKVMHTLGRTDDGRMHQETRVEGQVFDAVVQYAFGSGDRGLTPIGRDEDGNPYEMRLSEYRDGQRTYWDVTSGHPRNPSRAKDFLGQPLDDDGIRRCLVCHVTDTRSILDQSGACANDRGIGCEKCHGPGGNHLRAAEGKFLETDPAIGRPTLASGSRVVKICAQCHSPRGQEVLRDDPMAVRFQGSTLTWSRCFTESNDTLDCTTCHDPHRNVSTSAAYYESKCLSCHPGAGKAGAEVGRRLDSSAGRSRRSALAEPSGHTTCPVNPSTGCIGCHMPGVKDVVPHSLFTDHYIRVHRD